MTFEHVERGGIYFRVANPDWDDPLDGMHGVNQGGRWNAPRSFPVVYLNKTVALARRLVAHRLRDEPYGPEDLDPDRGPTLAEADLSRKTYVDIVTDNGCTQAGLPVTYPFTATGEVVSHDECWPIGQEAWELKEWGIACRSATNGAATSDEELAWFQRRVGLKLLILRRFNEWFFDGSS